MRSTSDVLRMFCSSESGCIAIDHYGFKRRYKQGSLKLRAVIIKRQATICVGGPRLDAGTAICDRRAGVRAASRSDVDDKPVLIGRSAGDRDFGKRRLKDKHSISSPQPPNAGQQRVPNSRRIRSKNRVPGRRHRPDITTSEPPCQRRTSKRTSDSVGLTDTCEYTPTHRDILEPARPSYHPKSAMTGDSGD